MAATPVTAATGDGKAPKSASRKLDPRKAHWEADDNVPHCRLRLTSFTLTTRRHHCRACGQIFCGDCSRYYLLLPEEMGYPEPRRVCRTCLQRHSTLNYSQTYDVFGENNQSTTILLMHDAMGNRQQLVYTAEFLADHGYRVVSFDFPGLGSKPNERLTMSTAVAATKEVVERHCGGSAVLCGFGLGGYVAMVFASQNLAMVKGMILCNTSFDLSGFSGSIISSMTGAVYKITPRNSLWSLVIQSHPTANREKLTRCYLKNVVDYDRWSTCAALLAEPHQGFFRDALRTYKGKIIMIIGDNDTKYAEDKFSSVMYDGRLAVIKGGHELMAIDDITSFEFHEILDGFLETLHIKAGGSGYYNAPTTTVAAPASTSQPAASSSVVPKTTTASVTPASSSNARASTSSTSASNIRVSTSGVKVASAAVAPSYASVAAGASSGNPKSAKATSAPKNTSAKLTGAKK